MNQMKTELLLAVALGILLGSGLAYSSSPQTAATAARPQLLTQPATQRNIGIPSAVPSSNPKQILIPLLVGLLFATPVYLLARKRDT